MLLRTLAAALIALALGFPVTAGPVPAPPTAIDLAPSGTALKDQGKRGTCAAFSVVAALEAAYRRAGVHDPDFSEEFLHYMAKAFWLDPRGAVAAADAETKLGAIERGSSLAYVRLLAGGFGIPDESAMPYRKAPYALGKHPNWDDGHWKVQANVDAFNLDPRNLPPTALRAPAYYRVGAFGALTKAELANAAAYEAVLAAGREVIIDFDVSGKRDTGGWRWDGPPQFGDDRHSMLIVGYDRARREFKCKDSSGGGRYTRIAYDYLKYVLTACYIVSVPKAAPWPELGYLGRWNLDDGKNRGVLVVTHIPGVAQPQLDTAKVDGRIRIDRRVGTFIPTGEPAKACRANGRFVDGRLEVWFDPADPNLPFDRTPGIGTSKVGPSLIRLELNPIATAPRSLPRVTRSGFIR